MGSPFKIRGGQGALIHRSSGFAARRQFIGICQFIEICNQFTQFIGICNPDAINISICNALFSD